MKIERAGKRDYSELMDLMARCFRTDTPDHPRFEDLLPDLYQPTDESMQRNFMVRDAGRIVASTGLYPQQLRMGEVELTVAGVGGVCTEPACRGKGYMTAILGRVVGEMGARGFPLSWLTGDRDRYAHFGWEKAGPDMVFQVLRGGAELDSDWTITPVDPAVAPLEAIVADRERLVVQGVCDVASYRLKLHRLHMMVFEAVRGGEHAYCVINTFHKWLAEWGGALEGVRALVRHGVQRCGALSLRLPPLRDEYTDLFLSMAGQIGGPWENVAVLDLPSLFRAYEPHLMPSWPKGAELSLVMEQPGGRKSEVHLAEGRVVSRACVGREVRLDPLRMARFLFGPVKPSLVAELPSGLKWLEEVLPLPFYVPSLWRV